MIGTEAQRLKTLDRWYPVWEKHTLWTHFLRCEARFPDNDFIVFEDCTYNYRQAKEEICRLARCLYVKGVRPGDHVALLLPNSPANVWLIFALAKLGATRVPLNTSIARKELEFIINHTDAKYLITSQIIDDDTLAACPSLRGVVVMANNKLYDSKHVQFWSGFLAGEQMADQTIRDEIERIPQDPDSLSDIMFTSGSTSRPKGVMLTHDMVLRSAYAKDRTRCFEPGRRVFAPIPLFHAFCYLNGLLSVTFVGGALIMLRRKYNARYALSMIRTFRANDLLLLGPIALKILTDGNPRPEDYPDVHAVYCTVSVPDWVWDAVKTAFATGDVTTGFGMTEICGSGVMIGSQRALDGMTMKDGSGYLKNAGSAGVPECGGYLMKIKVVDPNTGIEVAPGELGEVYYKGVTVTPGYYNEPELTNAAFTPDGWLKSGDMATLTADGYLTYAGRNNDMYKINGENVSPYYLDEVIGQSPLVTVVQTVGVMHPRVGEVGVAFIHPVALTEETEEAIMRFCRENLARFQVCKYYFFSDSRLWPTTPSGKLSKKLLRALAVELISKDSETTCRELKKEDL